VFKIFRPRADAALPLNRQGRSQGEVLAQTAWVVGVKDLSLTISAGPHFVILGLSRPAKSHPVRHLNRPIDTTSGEILVDVGD
ncbi:glycine betaine/L-proline ABC transporter ATP-binding protein, partial [Pseudomonas aeruginosa]